MGIRKHNPLLVTSIVVGPTQTQPPRKNQEPNNKNRQINTLIGTWKNHLFCGYIEGPKSIIVNYRVRSKTLGRAIRLEKEVSLYGYVYEAGLSLARIEFIMFIHIIRENPRRGQVNYRSISETHLKYTFMLGL